MCISLPFPSLLTPSSDLLGLLALVLGMVWEQPGRVSVLMTEKITTRGDLLFLCFLGVARVMIGMKKKKKKKKT